MNLNENSHHLQPEKQNTMYHFSNHPMYHQSAYTQPCPMFIDHTKHSTTGQVPAHITQNIAHHPQAPAHISQSTIHHTQPTAHYTAVTGHHTQPTAHSAQSSIHHTQVTAHIAHGTSQHVHAIAHNIQPTAHNTQTIHNSQTPAHNTQPTAHNVQVIVNNTQPIAHNTQPVAHTQPIAHNTQPIAHNTQPIAHNTQPIANTILSTNNKEITGNKTQTTNHTQTIVNNTETEVVKQDKVSEEPPVKETATSTYQVKVELKLDPETASSKAEKRLKAAGKSKNSVDTSHFTIEERLIAAVWVHERKNIKKSMRQLKHDFHQRFGRKAPAKNTLLGWERKLFSTGCLEDAPRTGRPVKRRSRVEEVAASVRAAPSLSLRARALALRVPTTTLHTILRRDLAHAPAPDKSPTKKNTKKIKTEKRKSDVTVHPAQSARDALECGRVADSLALPLC